MFRLRRYTFTQHVPAFISGVDPIVIKFRTIKELLSNPTFSKWSGQKDFVRFSYDEGFNSTVLMAEFDSGYVWWVVGYIDKKVDVSSLPKWVPKHRPKTGEDVIDRLRDRKERLEKGNQ